MKRLWLLLLLGVAACGGETRPVHKSLSVEPSSLDFGALAPAEHSTRTMVLFNDGDAPVQLPRLQLRDDARDAFSIGVAPATIDVGERAELVIVYVAPALPGPDSTTLVIETDSRTTPTVLVSIVGHVERPPAMTDDAGPSTSDLDAGEVDAGELDAGELDAGELDAGELDAGELDAGDLDAGEPDAGEPDAGVDAGAPIMRFVFVSSHSWDGDLISASYGPGATGSANAGGLCNTLSRDAGLGYATAIITEPGRNPATYLPLNGPWYRTDGALVFATREELLAGTPRVPINLDERGLSPGGYGSAWTGLTFSADGGLAPSTKACAGWSSSNAGTLGTMGLISSTGPEWLNSGLTNGTGASCSTALHLYCINQ